ncbi:MAG: 50S ribosomal protein L18 [Candidatus Nanoarchaeia archaeon]
MARGPRFAVKFRRRREGKTNYQKRLKLLKSALPRIVVRKSTNYITIQFVNYDPKGDRTLLTINSAKLKNFGWKYSCKNTPAAYLTGLLAGKLAKQAKIINAIADIGLHSATKGAKVFAAIKGAIDAGLQIAFDSTNISEDRILGKHIAAYFKNQIVEDFHSVKEKILK